MWVRGLKPFESTSCFKIIKSHPMWVRGLKPYCMHQRKRSFCRTLCGCVD